MARRIGWPTLAAALVLLIPAGGLAASEQIAGPVPAEVLRVVDGDTLAVRARIWLGQDITVNARIRGIDAPELHGRCQREKDLAEAARLRLAEAAGAKTVQLTNIENDKYAGRILADVGTDDGADLGAVMLGSGLVRPYDGGERAPWCGVASLGD
jgi:endonuclease YncB( thermonuclease family)